ncbi:hypothetical protein J6590_031496 [Homalodisca vitripennis]|nr:hypothetical protein J6590_031496 [Homalodisca vitripennis]
MLKGTGEGKTEERTGHGGYMTVSGGGLRVDCWLASLDRWLQGSGVIRLLLTRRGTWTLFVGSRPVNQLIVSSTVIRSDPARWRSVQSWSFHEKVYTSR